MMAGTPVSLEPGELPSSYGINRLVLLPVDPYLMYTYWELAADPPPTAGARAVLRFHEAPVSAAAETSRPFDVDIDLAAGNWYVHLWSPEKVYQADLGLRGDDGAFVVLAQSNTVQTPPAQPRHSGPAAMESAEPAWPGTARPVLTLRDVPPDPVPAPDAPEPELEPEPEPELAAQSEPELAAESEPEPVTPSPRVDVAAHLQQRLHELFAIRGELPPMPEPYPYAPASSATALRLSLPDEEPDIPEFLPDDPVPFHLETLAELDLTAYSEQRFSPGISSQGGPLGE
jgi:hypothetical protein